MSILPLDDTIPSHSSSPYREGHLLIFEPMTPCMVPTAQRMRVKEAAHVLKEEEEYLKSQSPPNSTVGLLGHPLYIWALLLPACLTLDKGPL